MNDTQSIACMVYIWSILKLYKPAQLIFMCLSNKDSFKNSKVVGSID